MREEINDIVRRVFNLVNREIAIFISIVSVVSFGLSWRYFGFFEKCKDARFDVLMASGLFSFLSCVIVLFLPYCWHLGKIGLVA